MDTRVRVNHRVVHALAFAYLIVATASLGRATTIALPETTDFSNDSSAPTPLASYDPVGYLAGLAAHSITVTGKIGGEDILDYFVFSGLTSGNGQFAFTFSGNDGKTLGDGVLVILNSAGSGITTSPTDTPLAFADSTQFTGTGIIPDDQIILIGLRDFGGAISNYTFTIATVATATPEPATWIAMALGLAGVLAISRRTTPAAIRKS